MLFLVKAASNVRYLHENLEIMAAPPGAVVNTRYRRRWVRPDLVEGLPDAGDKVCIIFSDPPWKQHIPVRFATLEQRPALEADDQFQFDLRLEAFVEEPNPHATTNAIFVGGQQQYFVFQVDDALVSTTTSDLGRAWRRIIDRIVGHGVAADSVAPMSFLERYRSSVFFRFLKLIREPDGETVHLDGTALQVGTRYTLFVDCYAPNIPPEMLSMCELVGTADPPLIDVMPALPVPDGLVSIRFVPRLGGSTTARIWIRPEQSRSPHLNIALRVEGSPPAQAGTCRVSETALPGSADGETCAGLSGAQANALFRQLENILPSVTADAPPDRRRLQLVRLLQEYSLDTRSLRETEAVHLFRLGDYGQAVGILEDIGLEGLQQPEAVAAFFLSCWRLKKPIDLGKLLNIFSGKPWPQDLVKRAREEMPLEDVMRGNPERQDEVIEGLWSHGIYDSTMLARVVSHTRHGSHANHFIRQAVDLGIVLKSDTVDLMKSWLPRPDKREPDCVVELLIDYALESGDPVCLHMMAREHLVSAILERGGTDLARQWRGDALRHLTRPQAMEFVEALAVVAHSQGTEQWDHVAGELWLDVAEYFVRGQDEVRGEGEDRCFQAGYALRQAKAALYTDESYRGLIEELRQQWLARVEKTEAFVQHQEALETNQLDWIRQQVRGKRVHFVGGLKRNLDPNQLAHELGFSEGIFHQSDRSTGSEIKPLVDSITYGGADFVLYNTRWGPHDERIEAAVNRAREKDSDVHLVYLNSFSPGSVARALWKCLKRAKRNES